MHLRDLDFDAVAGGGVDGLAAAFHGVQGDGLVAAGMDDFQCVAHGKFVFDFDGGPAFAVDGGDFADVLAAFGDGVAGEVVLVVLGLVAFQKA